MIRLLRLCAPYIVAAVVYFAYVFLAPVDPPQTPELQPPPVQTPVAPVPTPVGALPVWGGGSIEVGS